MTHPIRRAAAAATLAVATGLPSLGQQTEIATKPGSGVVRMASRRPPRPKRTPEQIAKHAAKLRRRYARWASGLARNPCLSREQFRKLLGDAS